MWKKKFRESNGCALLFLVICVGFIVVVYLHSEEEDPALQVFVKQGVLKGHQIITRKGRHILGFQRIPYALPPVGDLRFRVRAIISLFVVILISCFLLCQSQAILTEVLHGSPQDRTAMTAYGPFFSFCSWIFVCISNLPCEVHALLIPSYSLIIIFTSYSSINNLCR